MSYEVIMSLPTEVRTWIIMIQGKEKRRFEAAQNDMAERDPGHLVQYWDNGEWLDVFRKMFVTSGIMLWKQTCQVIFLFYHSIGITFIINFCQFYH